MGRGRTAKQREARRRARDSGGSLTYQQALQQVRDEADRYAARPKDPWTDALGSRSRMTDLREHRMTLRDLLADDTRDPFTHRFLGRSWPVVWAACPHCAAPRRYRITVAALDPDTHRLPPAGFLPGTRCDGCGDVADTWTSTSASGPTVTVDTAGVHVNGSTVTDAPTVPGGEVLLPPGAADTLRSVGLDPAAVAASLAAWPADPGNPAVDPAAAALPPQTLIHLTAPLWPACDTANVDWFHGPLNVGVHGEGDATEVFWTYIVYGEDDDEVRGTDVSRGVDIDVDTFVRLLYGGPQVAFDFLAVHEPIPMLAGVRCAACGAPVRPDQRHGLPVLADARTGDFACPRGTDGRPFHDLDPDRVADPQPATVSSP